MAVILFYAIDSETFEDIPLGSVAIEGEEATSDNEDLLDIVYSALGRLGPVEGLEELSSWSNGYLRSELEGSSLEVGEDKEDG